MVLMFVIMKTTHRPQCECMNSKDSQTTIRLILCPGIIKEWLVYENYPGLDSCDSCSL